MMNKEIFWEIIDTCRTYANSRKDEIDWEITDIHDIYIDYLRGTLSTYSTDDVIIFDRIFSFYHSKLYRDNLWNWLINEGYHASDDAFHYFISWIISLGHDAYMECISKPNILENFVDDDEDIYFERLNYIANQEISGRIENLTGKLNTILDNNILSIKRELEEYWTEDEEYGPIKRGIEDWKNEKKNVCQEESKEELKPDSGDKYGNSHFLMSFFKDEDGSILVNCNEDCENCPMEMLGEKCE